MYGLKPPASALTPGECGAPHPDGAKNNHQAASSHTLNIARKRQTTKPDSASTRFLTPGERGAPHPDGAKEYNQPASTHRLHIAPAEKSKPKGLKQ